VVSYILTMILGTCVVRLLSLHKDTPEERSHPGYQIYMFLVTLFIYTVLFEIVGLIITHI
jgi:hypothetical protein